MKNYLIILLIICCFNPTTFGQKDYYVKDKQVYTDINLINMPYRNATYGQMTVKDSIVKLMPNEVEEYGFKDGTVHQSFSIVIDSLPEKYFVKRMLKGRINLYTILIAGISQKYFINSDDLPALIEVPASSKDRQLFFKKYLNDTLVLVTNIDNISKEECSLIRLLDDYNKGIFRPLQRIHFGMRLGADATQLLSVDENSIYSKGDYNTDWNLAVGFFMDLPFTNSNYSFAPEINFKSLHTSESIDLHPKYYDLQLDYTSIEMPLFIRYTILKTACSPYIQAGPMVSRMLKNSATLYEFSLENNFVDVDLTNKPILSKTMVGYSAGCGLISKYGDKVGWFGEMRYSQLYNSDKKTKNFNLGDFSFIIGLIF